MKEVRAKKKLGQHFLKDLNIAKKIAQTIDQQSCENILEIGPGMGVLTQYLLQGKGTLKAVEIDSESVAYLHAHFPVLSNRIFEMDFLKMDISLPFGG